MTAASDMQAYNLKSVFEKSLQKYSDRIAIRYFDDEYSYSQLDRLSNALANGLVSSGVDREDRVAVLMSNSPSFVVSELAIVKSGGTKVLLNDMLAPDEIEYILRDSGAKALLCGSTFIDLAAELYDRIPTLETVIDVAGDTEQFVSYDSLIEAGDEDRSPQRTPSPEDILVHAYTGGTTGKPKGVLHTHRSRTSLYHSVLMELDVTGDEVLLVTTPLPHSAGSFVRGALLTGATVVLYPDFEVERTLSDIEAQEITWTFMVPTMVYRLLDHPQLDEYDLSSLDSLVYGAAPMKASRLREGLERLGPVFKQFYGQTEIPNLVTTLGKKEHALAIETDHEEWLSSAGQPCLMADVKIVDPEAGDELPTGEPGEILATAPYVMSRYHELPDATEKTLNDGWVSTGDIGKRDENGYVTLLDRKSNLVISGGLNVYTTEVEDVLVKHDAVKDAAVVGVPDDEWGEAVKAIVVAADGDSLSESALRSFARERLAGYKTPKSVDIVSDLPKTPYGKIDKTALREKYWDGAERKIN